MSSLLRVLAGVVLIALTFTNTTGEPVNGVFKVITMSAPAASCPQSPNTTAVMNYGMGSGQPHPDGGAAVVGTNFEFADDLHTSGAGFLQEITLFVADCCGTLPIDGTVRIYGNNADDTVIGPLQAGPYSFHLDASVIGQIAVIPAPDTPLIGQDVWLSVEFELDELNGVFLGEPPACNGEVVGTSHDLFLNVGSATTFGVTDFVANFAVCLLVEPQQPVPVENVTWSRIKFMYR